MPPARRSSRPSVSASGADDVANLTLAEVRDRLNRNNALLSSPLFNSPPTSPQLGLGVAGPGPNSAMSPTRSDPVRDKLVAARESLLAREQELMLGSLSVKEESNGYGAGNGNGAGTGYASGAGMNGGKDTGRRTSEGGVSGKAKVLERIKAGEGSLARNGLILPIDQTLTLGDRDYQNAAAAALSHLSINQTRSSSPKPRRSPHGSAVPRNHDLFSSGIGGGGDDEIARANRLARLNAFMSYKGSESDEDDFDEDEDDFDDEDEILDGQEGFIDEIGTGDERDFPLSGPAAGGYDGNGLPLRNVDSIGEEVDEYGEDDEIFAEGNDEYGNGAGRGTLEAGPGR
ncbi:hypothetical protein I317_06385 [Kwoniella heveanensis CBS 569]|nr:hypothetical protein I317_06385 [Kwoniella heveanensis CBS 569]